MKTAIKFRPFLQYPDTARKIAISVVFAACLIPSSLLSVAPDQIPLVITTNSILGDIANQLAGDAVEVISIVPIGADPHSFDAKPAEMAMVSKADLILVNGLNLENWIMNLIERSETRARVDTATSGIIPIMTGRYESVVDPHAWLDPVLGKKYVKNIAASLINLVPGKRRIIEFNKDVMLSELQKVHRYTEESLETIPNEGRVLITSHDAFRYFGERYQIRVESVFPASAEADITIKQMADLSNLIKASGVRAIFPESTINPRLIKQIALDNEIELGGKLYTDSLSDPEGDAPNYVGLLYHNAKTIYQGLKGEKSGPGVLADAHSTPLFLKVGILAILVGSFAFMWMKMDLPNEQ